MAYSGFTVAPLKAMTAGYIYTVAGKGQPSYPGYISPITSAMLNYGDGGPATSATFNYPIGVAVDASGNIYIADCYNCCIREVAAVSGYRQ